MIKSSNLFTIILLSFLFYADIVFAQKNKTIKPSITAAATTPTVMPPKKEGIKPFAEVITAKAKSKSGLFKTHRVDDKWYFEIPDSILKREMLVVTRLVKTPFGIKVRNKQYGGELLNEQVWQWERRGKQIFIRVPSYSVRANQHSDMYQSVKNSNLSSILASFDIKAYNKDTTGVIIDVTDFYNSDVMAIGANDDLRKAYKVTAFDGTRSYLDTIKTFPLNIEVASTKTYRSMESPIDNTIGAITFEFNTSMLLLPVTPAKVRLNDARVGFFGQTQIDYGTDAQKAERTAYIHRWNLVPKDTVAYKRGELVEPVKPIIIYIDPATPKKWVPYLIAGINDWQKAFEAAGFKNAIIGKEAPTPAQDPEFSVEDSRYSVIRYFASDIPNAYGPHLADPRSGQILETHIGWYHNVMSVLKNWFFIQTAAISSEARKAKLADDQMGELIRFVSSHEVGHTLGLPHNFGSSYAYPVDSLRSKTFTDKYSTAPSIMDYARFNYVAQPGDGVLNIFPGIGEYDKWSIKWGYTWFPGNLTVQQEKEKLDVWTKEKAGNPLYTFGRQGHAFNPTYDPRAQSEDLGDNAMKASTYGIANLKRILPNIEKWTYQKGKDFSDLDDLYGEVISQFSRYMGHVVYNIGGQYENFKTNDQAGAVYRYVSKAKQKEAIAFLNKQLFNTPLWLVNNEQLNKFDRNSMLTTIKGVQTSTIDNIFSSSRLLRLLDNEAKNGSTAYTIVNLFADVRGTIFALDKPDSFKRNLQRGYISRLASLMIDTPVTPGSPFAQVNIGMTDIRAFIRVELKNLLAIVKTRAVGGDSTTKAHYEDLVVRINDILNPKK